MGPDDRFGLVLFGSHARMIGHGMVHMDGPGESKMLEKVKCITTDGRTNLSGGLVCGLEMLERLPASSQCDRVASILLMTDGEANEGYTKAADIIKCFTPQGRASLSEGEQPWKPLTSQTEDYANVPTINTFGFGDTNAFDDLLVQVSRAGNGMAYLIKSTEEIFQSCEDCFAGLVNTVAENISVKLETSNGVTIESVFSGRDNYLPASGEVCTLPLGNIQLGESRHILVNLVLPKLVGKWMDSRWQVMSAKLSYFNVITSLRDMQEIVLNVSRPNIKQRGLACSWEVDAHKNRAKAVGAMQKAVPVANARNFVQAKGIMQMVSLAFSSFSLSCHHPLYLLFFCVFVVSDPTRMWLSLFLFFSLRNS